MFTIKYVFFRGSEDYFFRFRELLHEKGWEALCQGIVDRKLNKIQI